MQIQGKPLLSSLDFFREPKWKRRGDHVHRMRDDGVVESPRFFKNSVSSLFSSFSLERKFFFFFPMGWETMCRDSKCCIRGKERKGDNYFYFSCARTLVRPSRNCFQPKINVFVLSARRFMGIPGSSKLRFDLSVFYICPRADMPRNWSVFFAKIWIFFSGKQCVFPLIAKSISFRHVSQKEFWTKHLKKRSIPRKLF